MNIYGASSASNPPPPFNVVQVVRNFQTPMNHAYNLTIEQQLSNKMAFSIAYVGTAGRDLVNWRDLNACHTSTDPVVVRSGCGSSLDPRPFDNKFVDPTSGAPLYDHALQLNNDGYSNYNSLQLAYKVRDLRGLTGQVNYTWSRAFDTGSANRGGTFLSDYQNPYNVNKGYAPSDFDTPWNVNFTLVYDVPKVHALPRLIGDGWSINSLFRAQDGRPFSVFTNKGSDPTNTDPSCAPTCTVSDPSGQGIHQTYANYDGSPLHYDFHNSFSIPAHSRNPSSDISGILPGTVCASPVFRSLIWAYSRASNSVSAMR